VAADWFRTPDWDVVAREAFEKRLARARPHNRSQYLRIKALSLREAGLVSEAERLLVRVLEEYPDAFDVPFCLELLGDLAAEDGRLEEAIQRYGQALEAEPHASGTTGTVQISIAEALVRLGRLDEAVTMLLEADDEATVFHSALFRYRATFAEAAHGLGDTENARAHARAALELLDAPDQFSRHPGVGRAHSDSAQIGHLCRLAGDGPDSGQLSHVR